MEHTDLPWVGDISRLLPVQAVLQLSDAGVEGNVVSFEVKLVPKVYSNINIILVGNR